MRPIWTRSGVYGLKQICFFSCNDMHAIRYASDLVNVDKAAHVLRLSFEFVIFALVCGMM